MLIRMCNVLINNFNWKTSHSDSEFEFQAAESAPNGNSRRAASAWSIRQIAIFNRKNYIK